MAEPSAPPGSLNEGDQEHLQKVLGWASDALTEGELFMKSQPGYDTIQRSIAYIMGDYTRDIVPGTISRLVDNRFGKIGLDFSAAMTDIKPFWNYDTYNKRYESHQVMGNKITKHWWTGRLIDMKFCDAIKFSEVAGSGICHLVYNEQIGDNDCIPEDPRDVLPIRPSSNVSIQDAMGVIIRRERTVNYLKQKYPKMARFIRPDRDMSQAASAKADRINEVSRQLGMVSGFMQNLWASLGGRPAAHMNVPSTDAFALYVKDFSRNEGSSKVWVGEGSPEPGKHPNWSYWVEPGELLYPRGRTIVFTRTVVLRDGPSIYWHGLFPTVKITLDPWPWTWLGKPPLMDIQCLQEELNRMMRGVSDKFQKTFRPDLVADKNALSRAAMDKIDTRRAGLKLRHNPVAGKPPEFVEGKPPEQAHMAYIQDLRDEMDKLSGVRDLTQMMQLGQIPSTETVEKILESMSPAIRLRSRTLEASLREFAMMTLSNVFQFYNADMRMQILGPEGLTFEDFDEDAGSLIPAFLTKDDKDRGVVRPQHVRAREFLRQFTYDVAPGSLLSASEVTQKLLYIQLFRAGVLDIWTLAEKLNIPNYGKPPGDAQTITDRLQAMQAMGLQANVSPTGRKASGDTMPHVKPSTGGITESK